MRSAFFYCMYFFCVSLSLPTRAETTLEKSNVHPVSVDSARDSSGVMHYRIRCDDISVRVHKGHWLSRDSVLFFTEQKKTEWASTILKSQLDQMHDSLQTMLDSAGALIAQKKFTEQSLETAVADLRKKLESVIVTHRYSLHRLEDYQSVLNTVRRYLHGASSR